MSEREQIEAWLTSVENRRFGYNGADKTVAGPMRRSLDALDAANARADEAEREVARLRAEVRYFRGDITKDELRAAFTPEDTQPDADRIDAAYARSFNDPSKPMLKPPEDIQHAPPMHVRAIEDPDFVMWPDESEDNPDG